MFLWGNPCFGFWLFCDFFFEPWANLSWSHTAPTRILRKTCVEPVLLIEHPRWSPANVWRSSVIKKWSHTTSTKVVRRLCECFCEAIRVLVLFVVLWFLFCTFSRASVMRWRLYITCCRLCILGYWLYFLLYVGKRRFQVGLVSMIQDDMRFKLCVLKGFKWSLQECKAVTSQWSWVGLSGSEWNWLALRRSDCKHLKNNSKYMQYASQYRTHIAIHGVYIRT